jgi:hypothetical protein
MLKFRWWLAALTVVIACESTVESQQQQDLWNALGIRNYTYVYTQACFCGFTGPNPARITVKNGVVTSVTSADSAHTVFNGNIGAYPTIDSLFAIAARAQSQNPATFDITYDETYHFPRVIYVDPVQRVADDEVTYRAESFTPSSQ